MPIRSAEYWDKKAQAAKEKAEATTNPMEKSEILRIAQHYRDIAEQARVAERDAGK